MKSRQAFSLFIAAATAAAMCSSGCGSKSDGSGSDAPKGSEADAETEVAFDDNILFDLYVKVDEILQTGDTNAANAQFFAAFDDPKFEPVLGQMFSTLMRYLLFTEQVEEAKSRYLAELRTAPDRARPSWDFIYGWLMDRGRRAEALDWARSLSAQDIPEDLRIQATDWLASGLLEDGDADGAIAAVSEGIARFSPASFAPVAIRLGQNALDRGDLSWVGRLVETVKASPASSDPAYAGAMDMLNIRLLAAKGDWKGAAAALPAVVPHVTDAQLVQTLRAVFRLADAPAAKTDDASGAAEGVDEIAFVALGDEFAGLTNVRALAARTWAAAPFKGLAGGHAAYPGRLEKLIAMKLPPKVLSGIFARHFYDLIDETEILRAIMPSVAAIKAMMSEDEARSAFIGYELDAAFLLDDFAGAARIIEAGVPDHDHAWHELTLAKVNAHLAMQQERWAEAADNFAKFVELLPDEDQTDPASGIVYSRKTLVANNEKRIAGLWDKAGEPEKAAAAREAARKAYAEALEENKAGDETAEYIRRQAAELDAE